MVVVPKQDPLIKYVLREAHPLPNVDETLEQLAGAKIYSKLNANSGFWQIPLAKESQLLTTFVTPYGLLYCLNELLNKNSHFSWSSFRSQRGTS